LRIVQRSEAFAVYSYINIGTFRNKWIVAGYSKATELQRPEAVILNSIEMEVRDQPVLDLGVGSGRTTPHLRRISSKYTGLDYSPEMIATCRRSYPGVDFLVGDARDLSAFEAGSFGLIFFSFNGIDYVGHVDRLRILAEARRLLRPGGFFVFSTHNRDAQLYAPWHWSRFRVNVARSPLKFAKRLASIAVGTLLHLRNRKKEVDAPEYAIRNDEAHRFSLLTYYIRVEDQIAQLQRCGFDEVRAVGRDGAWIGPEERRAWKEHWIYYVARRTH